LNLFASKRPRARVGGQTSIEIIVSVILISLAIVLMVAFYGRTLARKFSCAAESVSIGRSMGFTCPGEAGGDDGEGAPEPEEAPDPDGEPSPGGDGSRRAGGGGDGRNAADGANDGDDGSPSPTGGGASGSGGGPSASSDAPSSAPKKLEDAKELLESTARGREILKFLDDQGIAIELQAGDGSVYNAKQNKIVIDSSKGAEALALTIAHEANHAFFDKTGKTANIDKDTRADFVRKMIEEEAVGTVASIQMKKDLQAAGKTITATYPLEKEYDAAFKKAVEDLKAAKPSATQAELDAAGEKAGLDAVRNGFLTGKVVTSNTKEKYPDYYGRAFDRRRAKPGSAPLAAPEPLQSFEVIKKEPKTGFEKLSGQIDPKERRAMENFMAQGTITEAVDLLRKTGTPINGRLVVEIQSTTGSDRFEVRNPTIVVRDDGYRSSGRVPPSTSYYPDTSKNEIVPVTDPKDKTHFVVSGALSSGEVAFDLFRQREALGFRAQDAKNLDEAVRELDPYIAREQFVDHAVDDLISRNLAQIRKKQALQRAGGTVNTPIPLEAEYNAAFAKAYNEELGKRGAAGAQEAISAGHKAGVRAIKETIESGKIVTHTGEKYADHFRKTFDAARADFAGKNPDIVKKNEETLKEQKRKAKVEEARKAIIELINKVDPDSEAADHVIALVSAFRAQYGLSDTPVLPNEARKGLVKLLDRYGFKDIDEVGSFQNENARLDYALGNFAALDPSQRKALRTGRARPEQFGIKTIITYEEMMDRENQKVSMPVGDGKMSIQVTRRERRELENQAAIRYALESLAIIRQPGPAKLLGAFFGEESMRRGAAVDTVLVARYGGPANAAKRGGSKGGADKPSGRDPAREYQSGAPLKPIVKSEPAPAKQPIPPPDRPGQPAPRGRPLDATQPQPQVGFDKTQQVTQKGQAPGPQSPPQPSGAGASSGAAPKPPIGGAGGGTGGTAESKNTDANVNRGIIARKREADKIAEHQQRIKDSYQQPKLQRRVGDGDPMTAKEALDLMARGGPVVVDGSRKSHDTFYKDAIGANPDPKVKAPTSPVAYRYGNGVRLDSSRLSKEELDYVRAFEKAKAQGRPPPPRGGPPPPKGGGGGAGGAGGAGGKDGKPAPPPQSQSPPGGNTAKFDANAEPRGKTSQTDQRTARTKRDDVATGKFPAVAKPQVSSAELEKHAKAIAPVEIRIQPGKADATGVGPGNFSEKDVGFGLARGIDGKEVGALEKFKGKAEIPPPGIVSRLGPDSQKKFGQTKFDSIERNSIIAEGTIAFAKEQLGRTGGQLRFSLRGFSVQQALTPGSDNFRRITSAELRGILSDPFFSGRVKFYDANGKDVTAQTLRDAQRFLKQAKGQ
jgi:hypothetical protein